MAEQSKPGSIVHVEFAVKDAEKVKKFYGELFGWTFQDIPEMNYAMFETPSGPGGGIGPLQPGQGAGIMNYMLVTSIDEQMKKIEEAGGKILMPKQEVPGFGFVASFEDPAGTKMGLYQASPQAEQP